MAKTHLQAVVVDEDDGVPLLYGVDDEGVIAGAVAEPQGVPVRARGGGLENYFQQKPVYQKCVLQSGGCQRHAVPWRNEKMEIF